MIAITINTTLKKSLSTLHRVNTLLTSIAGVGATLLLAAMLLIMVAHVFMRYVMNDSFGWTEELARFMMVWMTFLFFPAAHKKSLNVSLEIISNLLKGTWVWRLLQLCIEVLILIMLIWCIHLGLARIERTGASVSLSLGIEMAKVYWILPLSFTLMSLCSFERILQLIASLYRPDVFPYPSPDNPNAEKMEH